jgi:dephospho-CoA kinase
MIIIGITGTIGAGKGTIVEYLVNEKGFDHYSVREFLLEEIRKREKPENRDSMLNLANELRAAHGPSYVVDQLYSRAAGTGRNSVIESIRTTGEIDSLRHKANFILFAVDADPQVRFQRIQLRQSETDRISFKTFLENESREMTSTDPGKPDLARCISLADVVFINDGSKEDLFEKIGIALPDL